MGKGVGAAGPKERWPTRVVVVLTLAGLASIVCSVFPAPLLPHMAALALLALVSAAGFYRRTRWGLPLSLITVALYAVTGLTETYVFGTLYVAFGDIAFAATSALAGVLTALATLLFLYVFSKRSQAERAEPQPT